MTSKDLCPFCKNQISEEDRTCPHCGSLCNAAGITVRKGIEAGTILSDRYKIIQIIGKGGMGTVYKAEETTLSTGRHVAIKLLPPQMTMDESIISRFQDEIRIAARLDHPNIVPIYFVGEHEGHYYFVMKFLHGWTIAQLVKHKGPFSEDQARKILATVAEALHYAHSHGVIHRDIKPGNIMISPEGVPTLMDFGVARSSESSELTLPGQVIGTAEYMAPEQWYGEVDPSSDIYSLGVVLFYMLTGKLPFFSHNTYQLMKMHQEQPAPSLLNEDIKVSGTMENIYQGCLAKERENRIPTAQKLYAMLTGKKLDSAPGSEYNHATLNREYLPSVEKPASAVTNWRNKKLFELISKADAAYNAGKIDKAVKLAKKAKQISVESTNVDHRLKKFLNLKQTITKVNKRCSRLINDGFVRQAIVDYQNILEVFDLPEMRKNLNAARRRLAIIEEKFAEAKKLQLQGKNKKALKLFEEVTKGDAEMGEAMLRKTTVRKKILKKKQETKIRISIPLYSYIIIGVMVVFGLAIYKSPTLLTKSSRIFRAREMYATPWLFNTYTCYKALNFIEGPGEAMNIRSQDVRIMVEETLKQGNNALRKDNLTEALDAYKQAQIMLSDGSVDKAHVEELIKEIKIRMKVKQ